MATSPESAPAMEFRVLQAGRNRLGPDALRAIDSFVYIPTPKETPEKDRLRTEGAYRLYTRTLHGEFAAAGDDFIFLFDSGGRHIAHAAYSVGRRDPSIGIVNFVVTAPEWRGRGLSTDLCGKMMAHFRDRGGELMLLGHSGPVARGVYARCGFRDYHGRTMRWFADPAKAGSFDAVHFAANGEVWLRPADWGDGAMATVLYTQRIPWIVRDFTDGTFWRPDEEWTRSTSIFYALYARSEKPGHSMHVLVAAPNRVVGCVSIVAAEGGPAPLLEFMIHPNFAETAVERLRDHLRDRPSLASYSAPEDAVRNSILGGLGFQPAGPGPRPFLTLWTR